MQKLTPISLLASTMVLAVLVLAYAGGLSPNWTPDTDTYLRPWTWASIWGESRSPLLGLILAPFNDDYRLFPLIVIMLFLLAVYFLYKRIVSFGASEYAALALTLPLIASNSLFRYARDIHAEFLAVVLLLYALAELIGFQTAARRRTWRYASFTLALGASYILRPTFLPFIGLMPLLSLALGRVKTGRCEIWFTVLLFILCVSPFLVVSTIRYAMVNDFNTVSFGGFAMTGMTSSMLNEQLIRRLAQENQDLARSILDKREKLVGAGEICPMAIDYDTGVRSFRRTARSHFDMLSYNFDEIAHKIVKQTERKPGETWVQFNKRMMAFSMDVVRTAPLDYAMWVFGALRAATGTAIAQNVPFVIGLVSLLGFYAYLLFTAKVPALSWPPLDVPLIALITVIYTLGSGILMLLVSFPANRYVCTSALFMPAIVFYLLIRLYAATSKDQPQAS